MRTIISNGQKFKVGKITDLTNVSRDSELTKLTPGFYRINLHENFGGSELVVLVAASFIIDGTIRLIIMDNVCDYPDSLYWNGGWKIDNLQFDSTEDWIDSYDWSNK